MPGRPLSAVRAPDGFYLRAVDVVANLRARAAEYEQMALAPGDQDPALHEVGCLTAAAELEDVADRIDLGCIAALST
jgi:hypothetical protein